MARADLLVSLVKAGISGDTQGARSVAEAIIAEERGKQHTVLAERLDQVVRHGMRQRPLGQTAERHAAKELLYDLVPERRPRGFSVAGDRRAGMPAAHRRAEQGEHLAGARPLASPSRAAGGTAREREDLSGGKPGGGLGRAIFGGQI